MTNTQTILAAAAGIGFLLIAGAFAPVLANDPNWNGDPSSVEPAPPTAPPAVSSGPTSGGTVYHPYKRIYYALCTCTEFREAWGFETPEFRKQAAEEQCRVLRDKRQCKKTK